VRRRSRRVAQQPRPAAGHAPAAYAESLGFRYALTLFLQALGVILGCGCASTPTAPVIHQGFIAVSLRDESGGTLPGSCVTLRLSDGTLRCQVADSQGRVEFESLPSGPRPSLCEIVVKLSGFADLSFRFWRDDRDDVALPLIMKTSPLGGDTFSAKPPPLPEPCCEEPR
jgi:hypothetical protein